MNIFQQYGIKEVADVCLYAIELDENDDEVYVPVLYLDTLKVSTVEQSAESSSAQGGLGNPKLITWDYGKDITVTLEDALFSPASQGMMWGGKMGAKGLKLYLRNFWDRTIEMPTQEEIEQIINDHPEWEEEYDHDQEKITAAAYTYWLNEHSIGAVLTVDNFSDFCIIPERTPSYEVKENFKNQHTTGYVGGTSIYCWLIDATIASNDGVNKIALNDLILFYREQTQKWYFFNGKNYINGKSVYDIERYAIGYQYGKETFEWIKTHIANTKALKKVYTVNGTSNKKYHLYRGFNGYLYDNSSTDDPIRINDFSLITDSQNSWIDEEGVYPDDQPQINQAPIWCDLGSDFRLWIVSATGQSTISDDYTDSLHAIGIGFLYNLGAVSIPEDPTHPGEYFEYTINEQKSTSTVNDWWYVNRIQDGFCGSGYYLQSINTVSTSDKNNLTVYIYLGETPEEIVNTVFSWGISNKGPFSSTVTSEQAGTIEYEPVAVATIDTWTTNPPCAQYDRGPDYQVIQKPLDFLTQILYIDGFRKDKCARGLKYSDLTEEDIYSDIQPCRFEASIDLEYNTNIVPPQEVIYQIDHDLHNVFYLDRIEKCKASQRFCIDTDVNLKHGQYRYLEQYAQTELTVFIDPKTMQPYEPNTFEYYRSNGQRITGNLRAFKQHEVYYKWTRTKANEHQSLGSQIIVDATHFPGTYRLVGETYARNRKTGKDQRYQFEIPLCKMSANNNITLQADGDPTTFTMTLTALRRFDGVMMKLTMYDVEEDKYCKITSGSTKIVPQNGEIEPEEVNAIWEFASQADTNLNLRSEIDDVIDLATLIINNPNDEGNGIGITDDQDQA